MVLLQNFPHNIDGLLQDCSISIANPMEILQSSKPSICLYMELMMVFLWWCFLTDFHVEQSY